MDDVGPSVPVDAAKANEDPLLVVMRIVGAEAAARGLTPELLEAELAAHRAERRR